MNGLDVFSTLNFFQWIRRVISFNEFDVLSTSNSNFQQFFQITSYFLAQFCLIIRSRLLRQSHSVILLFRWRPKFFLLICLLILIVRIPNFQKSCIGILIVHYILVDFFGFSSNFTPMNFFDMLSIPNLQRIFYL